MNRRLFLVAGWLALAFIAYATLSPLEDRPVVAGPQFEHFAAFALLGFAFARGYPGRSLLVIAVVIGGAFTLEALQILTPDRHGRLFDALVKTVGGICGIGVGRLALLLSGQPIERIRQLVKRERPAG
jgi:VanZ family protein